MRYHKALYLVRDNEKSLDAVPRQLQPLLEETEKIPTALEYPNSSVSIY
jgi:hypothetical protein